MSPRQNSVRSSAERGASAVLVLVVLVGLLGVGGTALLMSRSEIKTAGALRLHQQALYAAESGVSVGMEYLRSACDPTTLFSGIVEPNNNPAQQPTQIYGNALAAGSNVFSASSELRYVVTILNNANDTGLAVGNDTDAAVILRSVGYGPDNSSAVVEVEVVGNSCLATFCNAEYAQRGMSARNDALAACSSVVASPTVTTYTVP